MFRYNLFFYHKHKGSEGGKVRGLPIHGFYNRYYNYIYFVEMS